MIIAGRNEPAAVGVGSAGVAVAGIVPGETARVFPVGSAAQTVAGPGCIVPKHFFIMSFYFNGCRSSFPGMSGNSGTATGTLKK